MTALSEAIAYPEIPLDAALLYGVLGWRVAPVRVESKVPAISDWVNAASSHASDINRWWVGQPMGLGVCIVTGRQSGLWVLDVDVADGKPGKDTLRSLMAEHDCQRLPETVVAVTPSGGLHYYFTYPEDAEVHNSASNRLGAGLDVRGEGGQVNAAPTMRAQGSYRWAPLRGPYDTEVAPAPAWLLEMVVDEAPPTSSPQPDLRQVADFNRYLREDPPECMVRFNSTTTWGGILGDDGWSLDHVDGQGVEYWIRPGKSERDGTSATVGYAGNVDMLYVFTTSIPWLPAERGYDRWGYMVHRDFGGAFDRAAREYSRSVPALSGAFVPPIVPGDGLDDDLVPDSANVSGTSRYAELEIDFAPGGSFWNVDIDATDFLIEPLILRARGHALYASAKVGKSYVVLEALAGACIPNHQSWIEPPKQPISIVYLDYEMTESDLRERLEGFGYTKDDDYSRFHYIPAGALGADLDTYEGGQELVAQAVAWRADLVVVDTLSRAIRGEENAADTLRDFYRYTGMPLKGNHIAVLRLDHAGKDRDRGQRGTSGKNDDVDVVWRLERTDSGHKLALTHCRVSWVPNEVNLRFEEDHEGLIRFVRTDRVGFIAGTSERAAEWLSLGIPLSANREQARDMGFKSSNQIFSSVRRFLMQEQERNSVDEIT